MVQNIMVVDLDNCIGCKGCQVACKMENDVAIGTNRTMVHTIGPVGTYPDLQMYFLPVMCQQCEDPTCVKVCPTGACYKNDDGVILIDKDACIGCKSCMRACPYEVNNFNKEMNIMDKCTLCSHLRGTDEKPACVKNCSGSALIFGDVNDPNSDVSIALRDAGEDNIYTINNCGSNPAVRYILRNADWVDVMPQDCASQNWRDK